jgi:anti-sigma factor RsiW
MNCAEIHEQVVLAAYGELPDDQAHALALHLAGCAECRQEQEQLLALKTLSAAYPVLEPNANLVARSRTRLEDSLDALPPKQWYDRVADWMTRTATGLQSAPVAACLLLVAGAGLGSLGGYEFAARHAVALAAMNTPATATRSETSSGTSSGTVIAAPNPGEIASVSGIVRQPNSNLVQVSYNQVEPRRIEGTLENPQIRQLLMLASQNGANPEVRNDSVGLLAAECRSGHGCEASGAQGTGVRDALIVALRYDRSAAVRQKALEGLQPFVAEDMQVRDVVLEALLNDPDARIRSAAISMLEPVEADTSVRQVLSTVALSDQNSHIRNASRVVLRRVSEVQ